MHKHQHNNKTDNWHDKTSADTPHVILEETCDCGAKRQVILSRENGKPKVEEKPWFSLTG
jgi:hypothetical protein